jgi:HlyD family secretion protein
VFILISGDCNSIKGGGGQTPFEGDRTFVEVATGGNTFSRREVTLGLSDGIHVQIKSGLSAEESIKVQTVSEKVRSSAP